ncbi:MAG: UPF0149 family protein [Gammaproteobacteria bacterium]|nr:UPF0149 family protein [Gammaproteobacteria bacterium]
MNTQPSPLYGEIQNLLDNNQYLITVAELQGLLMGFYSAGMVMDEQSWRQQLLKQLSKSEPVPALLDQQLVRINNELREMITGSIIGLALLLPEDDSPAEERGEALGYWCQGFLLGYMQLSENKDEEDEVIEDALDDLEEISNIDLDSIGSSEEDEKMLFEITEHIKVAAQIVHSVYGQRPPPVTDTLH